MLFGVLTELWQDFGTTRHMSGKTLGLGWAIIGLAVLGTTGCLLAALSPYWTRHVELRDQPPTEQNEDRPKVE